MLQAIENKRTRDLTEDELQSLRDELEKYTIEGDLRRFNSLNIARLKEIGCYRGRRHAMVTHPPLPSTPRHRRCIDLGMDYACEYSVTTQTWRTCQARQKTRHFSGTGRVQLTDLPVMVQEHMCLGIMTCRS